MRLLLDENFPKPALQILAKEGHDVLWIRTHAPGLKDKDVLHLAAEGNRIVLTLDKDFRQLALDLSLIGRYGVILFRIHPAVPDKIIPTMLKTLALELDWFGHTSVVSESAVRMLPLGRL